MSRFDSVEDDLITYQVYEPFNWKPLIVDNMRPSINNMYYSFSLLDDCERANAVSR